MPRPGLLPWLAVALAFVPAALACAAEPTPAYHFHAELPALKPWGPVRDLVRDGKPWYGFDPDHGAVLVVARAQRVESKSCDSWTRALADYEVGDLGSGFDLGRWSWKGWEPWSGSEVDQILDCDRVPCDVKLNVAETAALKAVPKEQRKEKFLSLILDRVKLYDRNEERPEHEFPGVAQDPWSFLEEAGFRAGLARPPQKEFRLRRLDFAPGKIKPLRQVLDRRAAVSPDRREAAFWLRDVYTDHYFDSWGEWADVRCDEAESAVWVIQAAVLELDLIKKTDLVSRLGRSRMRTAIQENGEVYLDRWFERLQSEAGKPGMR